MSLWPQRSPLPPQIVRLWPFALAGGAAFGSIPIPPAAHRPVPLVAAAVLSVLIAVYAALMPMTQPPRWREAVPALAYFVVIALLRHAEGGAGSGYGTLVLLPVLWLALYGTRPQLLAAFGAVTATFVLPLLIMGAPEYPDTEWRNVLLWLVVAPVVGLTTHRLVGQVQGAARIDPLTELPNRRGWDEAARGALSRSRRSGEPLSLAMVDIDGFKAYNDRFGHQAGDHLLEQAARAWRAALRDVDVIARYGGEEFAVLLPAAAREDARLVVERLRGATPAEVTCSAGVAQWDGREPLETLVLRADGALYEAKRAGRDRVALAPDPGVPS